MAVGNCRLQAYNVEKKIGQGSYGEVFLVTTQNDKKKYVMKSIKLTTSNVKERLGAEKEATLLSSLSHPNIVSYKESFQNETGVLYIIMGYCEGGDLCSRLKTYNSLLPETQVVEWFIQIALGLQYLHDQNILHRDLKTQNIFLSKNDIIKVGDLGIARVLDGSCDLAHTMVGTPYYMSPELFSNQPYNHKSDIWALGCCVYEMASLKQAFSARNINALIKKVLQGRVPPIPSLYSSDLAHLVQLMMANSSQERPSVHQILRKAFVRKHIKIFLDYAAARKRRNRLIPLSKVDKHCDAVADKQSPKIPHPLPLTPPNSRALINPEVVSSARQRRRLTKIQMGHGKVVHQSGSLDDVDKTSDDKASDDKTSDSVMDDGNYTDNIDGKASDGDSCGGERDYHIRNDPDDATGNSSSQQVHRNNSNPPSDEMNELCILLDSTLHLPKIDVTFKTSQCVSSQRLQDRIRALRMECESSLGREVVHQAMKLLSKSEEAEEELMSLLGVVNYELFAAKLYQLKLCEDSQQHSH